VFLDRLSMYKSYFGKVSMQPQDHQHSGGDKRTEWTLNDKNCGWCYIRKSNHPNVLVGHNRPLIYKKPYTQDVVVYDLNVLYVTRKR